MEESKTEHSTAEKIFWSPKDPDEAEANYREMY